MKIVNSVMPKKISYQLLLKLKSLCRRIMAVIYENYDAITSSPKPIKMGVIMSLIVILNGVFASNQEKENNHLIPNIAPQISHYFQSPKSNSSNIPGTFWFDRFDVQQKSARIKRAGYIYIKFHLHCDTILY